MAIRDGRVATISVHAVPFALGARELEPSVAEALDRLISDSADDCFLTAQAVGHVRPGTPGDGDTLTAHRLARARAELVRGSLVGGGLSADAVAAVWDYQFTVREPRVTLWIFRLPEGAECQGEPLPAAVQAVAKRKPSPARPEPPVVEAARAEPQPIPGAGPPSAPRASTPPVVNAGPPIAMSELSFDTGSSFFPRGAEEELRRLVAALPTGQAYRFEIRAGIDGKSVKDGDPEASARYNRWLSERRLARVSDWLEQHAEVREIEVNSALVEEDRSPRVAVRALPLP
jgi:outer membrane protein OmpA-like peptidoglycan-associated protein